MYVEVINTNCIGGLGGDVWKRLLQTIMELCFGCKNLGLQRNKIHRIPVNNFVIPQYIFKTGTV